MNRFLSQSSRAHGAAFVALGWLSWGCGGQDGTYLLGAGEPGTSAPAPGESTVTQVLPATPAAGSVIESEHIKTVRGADGSYASEVSAIDMASWVYFSLREKAEVTPDVPEQSPLWDLGFQRSNVKLNGGVSGTGSVRVAVVSGSFESVTAPPIEGFQTDAADEDADGSPDYALSAGDGWYSYDPASHRLTARETVFVLDTAGRYFKLQFSSYYDAAGTPGVPQFRWAPL
ncbi:MAG: hypothetical protein RL033_3232 [Pseudomonadota bacterium]